MTDLSPEGVIDAVDEDPAQEADTPIEDEPQAEAAQPDPVRCQTAAKAQERLDEATAELARVEGIWTELKTRRERLEAEVIEAATEHRSLAADAVAGKASAQKRVSELVARRLKIEHEILPSLAVAIEAKFEPVPPARQVVAQARAEIHRFKMLDAGREVVGTSREVDAAMENLTAALAARDEAVRNFSSRARTQVETETAYRLVNSSAVAVAWLTTACPARSPFGAKIRRVSPLSTPRFSQFEG